MKVLLLLGGLPKGGAETLVLDICRNSKKAGLDVVMVSFGGGVLLNEFTNSGIPFYLIENRHLLDFKAIFRFRTIVKKENISLIHSHSETGLLIAIIATIGLHIRKILHYHGFDFNGFSLVRKILYWYLSRRVDCNLAVSKSFMNEIQNIKYFKNAPHFRYLYNGIDFNKFRTKEGSLKEELNISDNSLLFGMIGNFNWGRDQMFVCANMLHIFAKYKDIFFVFVGNKVPYQPYFFENCISFCESHNIRNRCFFLENRIDVANILNSLDAFVYASKTDTFGIALVEAMYLNKIVLVNDIPAFLEVTNNGKYAFLYETKNDDDFLRKIEKLIITNEIKVSSKQWVEENFSIDKHIFNLKRIYSEVL